MTLYTKLSVLKKNKSNLSQESCNPNLEASEKESYQATVNQMTFLNT